MLCSELGLFSEFGYHRREPGLRDRVSHVMLNGRLYEAQTLNEVVTGARKTQPFFWQQ
jgi:hypothetical protein